MSNRPGLALLSLILAGAANAEALVVDVTPALTNDAGWVALGKVKTTTAGKLYLGAKGAALVSPAVDFAITSSVVTAYNSSESETRRILGIAPYAGDHWDETAAFTHAPLKTASDYGAAWPATAGISRVAVYCADGDRTSLYLTRIVLQGEPLIAAPTDLVAEALDTSVRLRWSADGRSVSNRVTLAQVTATPESWTSATHYGFDDCPASQASFVDQAALFALRHPEFSGEVFGFRSAGEMQLGTTDVLGWLGYAGRTRWRDAALRIRARRAKPSDKPTMPVWACAGDVSNALAVVCLGDDYAETTVPLAAAPDGATIWLNRPCATKTDQRVVIDDLWLYDGYAPATCVTNLVATATVAADVMRVTGLTPRRDYVWRVVSQDKTGRVSPPTYGAFRTLPRQGNVMLIK